MSKCLSKTLSAFSSCLRTIQQSHHVTGETEQPDPLLMSAHPRKVPAGVGKLLPSVSTVIWRNLGQRRKIPCSVNLWVFWRHINWSIYYCCSFLMALIKASNSSNLWWAPSPAMDNELTVTNSDVNSPCTGQSAINMNSLASPLTVIFISLMDWAKGIEPTNCSKEPRSKTVKVLVQMYRHCSSGPHLNHRCPRQESEVHARLQHQKLQMKRTRLSGWPPVPGCHLYWWVLLFHHSCF